MTKFFDIQNRTPELTFNPALLNSSEALEAQTTTTQYIRPRGHIENQATSSNLDTLGAMSIGMVAFVAIARVIKHSRLRILQDPGTRHR